MSVDQTRKEQADALYERYGKPLEAEQWGQYVAISPAGKIVLAASVLEVVDKAAEVLGPGVFVFKVGEKIVWKWR